MRRSAIAQAWLLSLLRLKARQDSLAPFRRRAAWRRWRRPITIAVNCLLLLFACALIQLGS